MKIIKFLIIGIIAIISAVLFWNYGNNLIDEKNNELEKFLQEQELIQEKMEKIIEEKKYEKLKKQVEEDKLKLAIIAEKNLKENKIPPEDFYRVVNFDNKSNERAREILREYLLKSYLEYGKKEDKHYQELKNLELSKIHACAIDLNDDGVDEIMGYVDHIAYWVHFGSENLIFVIGKQKDGVYRNLLQETLALSADIAQKIYITKTKTNGYRDFIVHGDNLYRFPRYRLKYGKEGYDTALTKEQLEVGEMLNRIFLYH